MNIFPYYAQSNPNSWAAAQVGTRPWIYPMRTMEFQTYDGGLNIKPNRNNWAIQAYETLNIPNACGFIVAAYGGLETDALQLQGKTPCPRFHSLPDKKNLSKAGLVLLSPSKTRISLSQLLLREGFEQKQSFSNKQGREVWVYKRPQSWFYSLR